ncbi:hypothetical protein F5Y16DRAFT_212639 [Xylariaceae sp. FL0255]|nr:hypothetical protein F5Y16DRAFT_212639 [Xylariaceae sp. FL0255]
MSRYFPHTSHAEDQPLSHTILLTHIGTRSITTGAIIGSGVFAAQKILRSRGSVRPGPSAVPLPPSVFPTTHQFLRVAGKSTIWTLGVVSLGTVARMWGREEIEWQDRSWRLLESKGQLETDDWTYGGMVAGLAASALLRRPVGGLAVLGAVSMGSVAGTAGYMAWRYGVNGGKFEE